jgi:hypothetical protein
MKEAQGRVLGATINGEEPRALQPGNIRAIA